MIENISLGIQVVFSAEGIFFLFTGCIIGTIVGILPGLGTVAALAILFPFTYDLSSAHMLMMMSGIYYGAQYGGSTTSILINTPGEISTVTTCIDGYPMSKKGHGGKAVVAAGIASLIGGIITIIIISSISPIISDFAFKFGSRELTLLTLLGLISISVITNKNTIAGIGLACIGILLGMIGTDINSGAVRFSNNINLVDGINIATLAIGLFGIAEIFKTLTTEVIYNPNRNFRINFSLSDFKKIIPPSLRGSITGIFFGIIPGGGTILSTFAAYALEKKISSNKQQFGNGAIEGVAAPESANNSAAQIGFIPLLTLGIPENAVMALILGALIVSGVQPGPGMIESQPEIFWGLIVSMLFGNLILVILNIPLVKIWLLILSLPKYILYVSLLIVSLIGVYSMNNSLFEVGITLIFGIFGYILIKLELEPAPLIYGFIIGPIFEEYFRRSLSISNGQFSYFIEGVISKILLSIIILLIILRLYVYFKTEKQRI